MRSLFRTGALVVANSLSAALLVGCGGVPIAEVRSSLASAKPCCAAYAELAVAPLQPSIRTKFELKTSSPAFPSPVGLAYAAAFTLPAGARSLSVQALSTEFLPKSTYPDPVVVFLDQAKRPIMEMADLRLQRGRHEYFPGVFEYFYGAQVPVPPAAQYVVVFAHPQSARVQRAVSDNGTVWPVPTAPVGTLALVANLR